MTKFSDLTYEPDWLLRDRLNHEIDTGKVKCYTWAQFKNRKK